MAPFLLDGAGWGANNARMIGTIETLLLAVAIFVGGHFFLSSVTVREPIIKTLGETGFRVSYSVLALGAMVWTVVAYNAAPRLVLWQPTPGLLAIPLIVMPFACILVVASLSTPNITMVAGEHHADQPHPAPGIMTITRHPGLWGFGLWSMAHLLANGDDASLALFGGIAVLCFGGMWHIDQRRRITLGSAWGPVALTTSVIPFQAALQRRTKIDWPGIGLARVAAGLALYTALLLTHGWAIGVSVIPG